MPDTGVSLIPRSSKTTKKKRTAFRPATRKLNQNKNKSGSSTTKKLSVGNDVSSNISVQNDPDRITTVGNQGGSKPLSSRSDTEQSVPQEKNGEVEGSFNTSAPVPETETAAPKRPTERIVTRSSSAMTTTSSVSTRKRKANSLNNVIRIGSSLRTKPTVSTSSSTPVVAKDGKNGINRSDNSQKPADETAIVTASKPQNEDEEHNDENIVPVETKKTASNAPPPSAIFPELSARDQATLKQLRSEGNPEGKSLLGAFCSGFKGPKRKLRERLGGAVSKNKSKQINNNNNAIGENSEPGSNSAADSSNDKTAAPSVQIIDGEIVLQESSVMFPARRTVQEVEEEFQDNVVEEDEQLNLVQASYTSFITKGDHGKTRKKGSWTIKETELFYVALRQLGTDFGSMEALFFENKRTRRQLKNKYRKELIKNPHLVEELALNPKYSVALDMTAFNLEVDPKRIEAHENEEPPTYEPTDEDGVATTPSEVPKKGNDIFEGEVVEEDAEEERRAEASAALRSSGGSSLWPTTGEEHNEAEGGDGFGDEMRGFPAEEGPSMEDFFHDDSYNDNDNHEQGSSKENTSESATAIKQDSSQLVSLVPKKSSSKSRRPKIRPSARRKIK